MSTESSRFHPNLPDPDFLALLQSTGTYKERSDETHDTVHAPLLSQPSTSPINCLLLGDSMLERFKTSGQHTKFGTTDFPNIFNAGVGGDRIVNVLFRLGTKDLFHGLQKHGVKFAILQMGTNDLRSKRGLTSGAIDKYGMVLEALRRAAPGIVIVVSGLMPRADVGQVYVERSNESLRQLVEEFNGGSESQHGKSVSESNPAQASAKQTLRRVTIEPSAIVLTWLSHSPLHAPLPYHNHRPPRRSCPPE
jgi:hypothetical protein